MGAPSPAVMHRLDVGVAGQAAAQTCVQPAAVHAAAMSGNVPGLSTNVLQWQIKVESTSVWQGKWSVAFEHVRALCNAI